MAKFKTPEESSGGNLGPGTLREGIRLFNMKRWDMALQEFLRINAELLASEEKAELAYYTGLCHAKLNHYDDALLNLEQVISAAGDMLRVFQCRMTLAYIYAVTKRSKMAEFELQKLQSNGFESAQLYTTMGYAAWAQKQVKNAVDSYQKALDMDEDNATAMNGLGYILADSGTDLSRGLQLCRDAVDRKPQNPAYLDSLGWACFKNGDLAEARSWIRQALDLAPHEKEIREHYRAVTGEGAP